MAASAQMQNSHGIIVTALISGCCGGFRSG